ncbi:MAG: metalloregulator ArsR/SmtB family transcription factor [Pseudomonadales bacterium]
MNHTVAIDAVFTALADERRRHLLEVLAESGPMSASDLADQWEISRQAIAKHLHILEQADLVERQRRGRAVCYAVNPHQLGATGRWLTRAAARWQQ